MSSAAGPSSSPTMQANNKIKKRKRKTGVTESKKDGCSTDDFTNDPSLTSSSNKKRTKKSLPLRGLIIAISTIQSAEQEEDTTKDQVTKTTENLSYKEVAEICRQAGATISGQVHRKVHCLLCSSLAIHQATQRTRKAIKKNIPLVDLAWLHQCIKEGRKLELTPFLIPSTKLDQIINDQNKKKQTSSSSSAAISKDNVGNDNQNDDIPESGWSSPVNLGCCCSCHEFGTTKDCEWCADCTA